MFRNLMRVLVLVTVPIALIVGLLYLATFAIERYVCFDHIFAVEREEHGVRDRFDAAHPKPNLQWVPDGSRIVFASLFDPREQFGLDSRILVVAPDGSSLHLTADGKSEADYRMVHSPNVSPNGTRVAYSTSVDESYLIETSTMNGVDRRTLTNGTVIDFGPQWSPDGSRIAFVRRYDRDACGEFHRVGIYAAGDNGKDVRKVVDIQSGVRQGTPRKWETWYHSGPKWSPEGELLAYVVNEFEEVVEERPELRGSHYYYRDETVLYTVSVDGSDPRRLLTFSERGYLATSSRAYVTPDEDLKRVGLFSEEPDRVIVSPPAWSPDGQRMAFVGVSDSVPRLYTINRDGSELHEVAALENLDLSRPAYGHVPPSVFWSPNGEDILFSFGDVGSGVYVADANANDSSYRKVAEGSYASWSPNGSRIAVIGFSSDDYLSTIAADGSDERILVRRNEEGFLVPANPAAK